MIGDELYRMHGNGMDAEFSSDALRSFARRSHIPICSQGAGAQRKWACATRCVTSVRDGLLKEATLSNSTIL
jgi:hypothetical protein